MKLGWRIKKIAEIRERALIFRRGVGTKNDKGYRFRMKTIEIKGFIYVR